DPAEAIMREVERVCGGLFAVHAIQVRDPAADALVMRVLEQVPVERRLVAPFAALAELTTHEEQLLARLREHVAEEQAQVREALPLIAGHAVEQGALPVYDLVVRERQHEVLVERVHHAERQLTMVI